MSEQRVAELSDDLNVLVGGDSGMSEETFQLVSTDSLLIKSENQELSAASTPYTLSLRRKDFDGEKELNIFIKACEGIIRKSPEYKIWTEYIREVLGHHVCEITGEMHSQTTVDIHHHPFSLYSIVKVIILEKITSGKSFCSYDISSDVIQLHYDMRSPFVLLIRSLHDKFHNGFLQLPMNLVHGDYKYLVENYMTYLEDEEADLITSRLCITEENCGWTKGYRWLAPTCEEPTPIIPE